MLIQKLDSSRAALDQQQLQVENIVSRMEDLAKINRNRNGNLYTLNFATAKNKFQIEMASAYSLIISVQKLLVFFRNVTSIGHIGGRTHGFVVPSVAAAAAQKDPDEPDEPGEKESSSPSQSPPLKR